MSFCKKVIMYFASQYSTCEFMCVRSRNNERLLSVLNKSAEETDTDFNLTNIIIDYKERQREKVLNTMKQVFREKLIVKAGTNAKNKMKILTDDNYNPLESYPAETEQINDTRKASKLSFTHNLPDIRPKQMDVYNMMEMENYSDREGNNTVKHQANWKIEDRMVNTMASGD